MYRLLLIATATAAVSANAQTHRFIYDVEYRKDSAQNFTTKENYHLDITSDDVKYYPRDFFVGDSLVTNNVQIPKGQKFNTSNILSHKFGKDVYEEYDILENIVLKMSTQNTQNWKLTGEKKEINNLKLQQAKASWGGRKWVAWFTSDIAFQEGPYKFHGLPGLITELYDDKNNYRFELVKVQNIPKTTSNQYINYMIQKSVPVSREKYVETKLKYYASPINMLRNNVASIKSSEEFFLSDGTKVGQNNSREVNERLRESVRKYNNPIELDKAIKYPE